MPGEAKSGVECVVVGKIATMLDVLKIIVLLCKQRLAI
jgi:hypothetical protein